MTTTHTQTRLVAAQALAREDAKITNVNHDVLWKINKDTYMVQANAVFEAIDYDSILAQREEMAEALRELFGAGMERCMLGDGKDDQIDAIAKARRALSKLEKKV